jgi:hypothetical protein
LVHPFIFLLPPSSFRLPPSVFLFLLPPSMLFAQSSDWFGFGYVCLSNFDIRLATESRRKLKNEEESFFGREWKKEMQWEGDLTEAKLGV